MSGIKESVLKVYKGAIKSFSDYPVSMISALLFSLVTVVRIQMEWEVQQDFSLLLNSLHFALALAAASGMALIAYVRSRKNSQRDFIYANLAAAVIGLITFILLYFLSSTQSYYTYDYLRLTDLSVFRVMALIYSSVILFVIFAGHPKESPDFSKSLYMTIRAGAVALIYGLVIMGGSSAVAGAIQALLFRDMSYKVYQYLGTISGFLGFSIFLGYFPDLSKKDRDDKRSYAEEQSRFVEVLLDYILIPIALALTVVFLVWTVRTSTQGIETSFIQLSGIATSYALGGLLLHVLVTNHEGSLPMFYKKVFPITALVILGFQLWALIVQISQNGLMDSEYSFSLIWIFTVISVILLLFKGKKSHIPMSLISILVVLIAVLPLVGYHSLPYRYQLSKLENILESEGMLSNNQINKSADPSQESKEKITEIVLYLVYKDNDNHPQWFSKDLRENNNFQETFGFQHTWPSYEGDGPKFYGTNLVMPAEKIDISSYSNLIVLSDYMAKDLAEVKFSGVKGEYIFNWSMMRGQESPLFSVTLNGELIIEESFDKYLSDLAKRYPPSDIYTKVADIEDMLYIIATDDINIMLVFKSIDININEDKSEYYFMNLNSIYLEENN